MDDRKESYEPPKYACLRVGAHPKPVGFGGLRDFLGHLYGVHGESWSDIQYVEVPVLSGSVGGAGASAGALPRSSRRGSGPPSKGFRIKHPDDIAHGTWRGYMQHRRLRERGIDTPTCRPCYIAAAAYNRYRTRVRAS